LTPGVNFTNILDAAFMRTDPKSAQKTDVLTVFFCAFGICTCKNFALNVDEIDPWGHTCFISVSLKDLIRFKIFQVRLHQLRITTLLLQSNMRYEPSNFLLFLDLNLPYSIDSYSLSFNGLWLFIIKKRVRFSQGGEKKPFKKYYCRNVSLFSGLVLSL